MKFTEATKDTQIALLALALAGSLEAMSKHTDDNGKGLVHETIRHIGLGLDDFKTLLDSHSDETKDEIFRITGVVQDLPQVEVYRQSDFDALELTYRNVSDETLQEDALHDGAINVNQLPMTRRDTLIAMLKHIEQSSDAEIVAPNSNIKTLDQVLAEFEAMDDFTFNKRVRELNLYAGTRYAEKLPNRKFVRMHLRTHFIRKGYR